MQISIESYLEKLMPWEFTVKYQQQVYTVRPLTIGDMMLIEAIGASGMDGKSVEKIQEVVQSLFVAPAPDVSPWRIEALMVVLTNVVTYFRDITKKNAEVIAMKIEA